ncbi:MAG: DNA polymerase III subunit chi [Pseudomonadota bacterium]
MGRVLFYHLTRSPLEATLATLLGKSLAAGFRVDVRGTDPARLEHLDAALWLKPEDGFLPHGVAGGPHDDRQPVLLTHETTARSGTTCLMSIDGATIAPEEPAVMERVCILFDGNNEADLTAARAQWRTLTSAGAVAEYWSQDEGPWRKKMSTDSS